MNEFDLLNSQEYLSLRNLLKLKLSKQEIEEIRKNYNNILIF